VLYSRSLPAAKAEAVADVSLASAEAGQPLRRHGQRLTAVLRHPATLWAAILLVGVALLLIRYTESQTVPHELTQDDFDAAVLYSLRNKVLPSQVARAVAAVSPSVVQVEGLRAGRKNRRKQAEQDRDVGTGVVIVDNGTILTNLHVVQGASEITVTFANGLESPAGIVSVQRDNDIAVLRARKIPDDLQAATLRSTDGLMLGDQVAVIGFPFGIGPSVSAGVVSGLERDFRSPEGGQEIDSLIQFDAAANPGNSGGPLVTMDGEVVGIVTAILNPTAERTFAGIGFAVPIENAANAVGQSPF
jgi:S1-C subfamily serine protease